jgi:hypothetical protein
MGHTGPNWFVDIRETSKQIAHGSPVHSSPGLPTHTRIDPLHYSPHLPSALASAVSAGSGCDEREQQNLDSEREINLRTLLEMGFEHTSENIRVLTDCKVPDYLY